MKNRYLENFDKAQLAGKDIPNFRVGDSLRIAVRITEGSKTRRIQNFEGVCIAIRGEGAGKSFIARKIGANSVGVERIFPYYSEIIEKIEVLRSGKVRRAKLFYLRDRRGKAARIKERKQK